MYKITQIRASSSGERLLLGVLSPDGTSESVSISCESYRSLGIAKGEIGEELYGQIKERSEYEAALSRGLRILGCGANSKRQLERKLRENGATREHARRVSDELSARGYLDEVEDAARLAEKLARKNHGKNRIISRLKLKGYSPEAIERAEEVLSEIDFVPLCLDVIRRTYKKVPKEPIEIKKAIAKLLNMGYNVSDIKEALRIAQSEEDEE